MNLAVLTDIHAAASEQVPDARTAERDCLLAAELAGRALEDARRRGGFDAVAVLGDCVTDAADPGAGRALAEVDRRIRTAAGEAPVLWLRGNHDPPARAWQPAAGDIQVHRIGGVQLVAFADRWDAQARCTRPPEQLRRLERLDPADGPIVALQHNPLDPVLDDDYPYMPVNRRQILAAYDRAAVGVSLSGHYHPGQDLHRLGRTQYATIPALCKRPFTYALLTVAGDTAELKIRQLADWPARPVDSHVHTELAYCGGGTTASAAVDRARRLGLGGLVLAEHAPQLYCSAEDFWHARHVAEPDLWRRARHSRIEDYFRLVEPLADGFCRIGLEVELDAAGDLTLRDEDRARCDTILGAIHWVPGQPDLQTPAQELAAFLRTCQGLCEGSIDVLAHPMRWLQLRGNPLLAEARKPLARMLAETGTATEINCHKDPPDRPLLAACLAAGVPVALASDAHVPEAVGLLGPNLALLEQALGGRDLRPALAF
jgi:histidinol phosphatase-like PHP family hydrolase